MLSQTCSKTQHCYLMILHDGIVVHFEIYDKSKEHALLSSFRTLLISGGFKSLSKDS